MLQAPFSTIAIDFVRRLLAGVTLAPQRRESLLQQAGIPPGLIEEDAARVTTEQFAGLYQSLARELDDELPGMFSRPARNGTFKFLCLGLLEAPTVRTALYRMTRFFRLFLDDYGLELTRHGDITRIALMPQRPDATSSAFAQEILIRLIHGVASWLAGHKLPLARVDFAHPLPGDVSEYAALFPGPAFFGQAMTAAYFETWLLDVPIRQNRRSLAEFLRLAPGGWLFTSFGQQPASHAVREYLAGRLHLPAGIEDVAQALHVSVRTLSRRLRDEGTGFQILKDELRRDLAIQALTKTGKPIAVIGAELGFDSASTFHRAFRGWTGSTPGAYRERLTHRHDSLQRKSTVT